VPKPPTPSGKVATLDEALAALETADPARGEALFLANGGAGCALCHTMNGRGHDFGPDLTGAGDRFDARHLLDSMLNPNAIITEGFAMMTVTMKTGGPQTGVLREQSGLHLTLAQPGGGLVKLERNRIAKEEMHPVSMMPPFGAMLNARQLADVTAFLLSQKAAPKTGFHLQEHDDHLDISLDGRRIATYQFRHDKVLRPVWINLVTPGGRQVTRNYPPRVPDDVDPGYTAEADGIIHPHFHTGLWLGFGDVDGHDFWRNIARIEQLELAGVKASSDRLNFEVLNRLLAADGQTEVCRQRVRYELARHPSGWQLDLAAEFFNDERDFSFGDQEESGLGVRVASPLRVQGGNGRITNSLGEINGAGTWGHEAAWWDYSGSIDGVACGIFVQPHATNPRPCWGHTRDYGVMVLNPFPRQPKERREPYVKTVVKKGERFRLGYSVIVHEGAFQPPHP
ncbi:MAG: PmoA family protein, partial [Verrucomicrobiae bacterium]|nr:PmoA family protein [Verrucomicrobiae bacterium]